MTRFYQMLFSWSQKKIYIVGLLLLCLTLGLGAGCNKQAEVTSSGWAEYNIYCGLSIHGGMDWVSSKEWDNFCEETIPNYFPNGFTVYIGKGYWRYEGQFPLWENTRIVNVVAEDNAETKTKIKAVVDAFSVRFHQESVLVTKTLLAEADFNYYPVQRPKDTINGEPHNPPTDDTQNYSSL